MASNNASKPMTATSSSLEGFERYSIEDVAQRYSKIAPSYFRECLRAYRDESYRKRRGIPLSRLRTLPLAGWERKCGRWTITHRRLVEQLPSL